MALHFHSQRLAALLLFSIVGAAAQSTQSLITGQVRDSQSGRPVTNSRIAWVHRDTGMTGSSRTGDEGIYTLPVLSPGTYQISVSAEDYQTQELHELVLPVAGRLEIDFRLRPLRDVWEQGSYRSVFLPGLRMLINFFGPDFDSTRSGFFAGQRGTPGALEATVSEVIDPAMIRELPFAGRDIYAALALMPGATSDGGTSRGLGLVVNGQRPSSSNFFLDGLEANNYLTGGPLLPVAPEAVQEYRFSTNNYSAQYGGTTGFIANAVTRAGGSEFHGILYSFVENRFLNANDFQRNAATQPRPSGKVAELGYQVGGPIWKKKGLFLSSSFDRFGSRTEQSPIDYFLPTKTFLESIQPDSIAYRLLSEHPSPASKVSGPLVADLSLAAPVSIQRVVGLERLDYRTGDGRHTLSMRLALARSSQPDFVWTPFQDLGSRFGQNTLSTGVTHLFNISRRLVNEAKAGFSLDDLHWNNAHSEIPKLFTADAVLPGSPGLYDYKNATKSWQVLDNLIWTAGRHIVTAGGGFLLRGLNGYMTPGQTGEFDFISLRDFGNDAPFLYRASTSYTSSSSLPGYSRTYRSRESSAFLQDTFRLAPRLVLNFGIRYEGFGSPVNVGEYKDPMIELGSGSSLRERLQNATVTTPQGSSETLWSSTANWEPRLGISYDLTGRGQTTLRASFGIFHDRLFDNLWQTMRLNDLATTQWISFPPASIPYLGPSGSVLARFNPGFTTAPKFTLLDPTMPASRSSNYFAGVQHRLTNNISLEVNTLGATGSALLTTDVVNRSPTLLSPEVVNPKLPFNIRYRGAQGFSDYRALTATLRYRTTYAQLRVNYTWSHSIDNQSNSLEGDQFDLTGLANALPMGFARQFDSHSDKGNADFDQRQNLVFYSIWEYPSSRRLTLAGRVLRHWKFSQLAAFRSGLPFSIYDAAGRVDIIDPNATTLPAQGVSGGIRVLNRADFVTAQPGSGRNSGRNAFRGPGLYNIDVSLSRAFALALLGESAHLVVRADAFNLLNHANLNNPGNFFPNPATFGVSQYGRKGFDTGFPASAPFLETPRQVQLAIRFEF